MRYQGSAAYQLDDSRQMWEVPVRRPLSVHEGGGLDARERQGVASMPPLIMAIMALSVVLALVGGLRVAVSVMTVSTLREVAVAEEALSDARDTRIALQVEHSALSNVDRIQRIATENYGMVYASDVDSVMLTMGDDASAEDANTDADASDARPVA